MASLIYNDIRAKIISGELKPGMPISSLSIAKASGTSRGPVREALRRLQQDDLVIARANQRFHVSPFDIADLEAVLSLHLVNITLAIRVGVPFLNKKDVEGLNQLIVRLDRTAANDAAEWEAVHREFVFILIKPTGDRTMSLIGKLMDDIQRYRTKVVAGGPRVLPPDGASFRPIAVAVEAHDGLGASTTYANVMGRVSSLIVASIAPSYNASCLHGYMNALLNIA